MDLDGDGSRGGTGRSRGMGKCNQDMLYGKKKSFSIKEPIKVKLIKVC